MYIVTWTKYIKPLYKKLIPKNVAAALALNIQVPVPHGSTQASLAACVMLLCDSSMDAMRTKLTLLSPETKLTKASESAAWVSKTSV